MAVFVTDGDQRPTLAVVRSLGREGISVTVGHTVRSSLAGRSRHCARTVCYPSPQEQPEKFKAFLLDEVKRDRYRVLLPMTDVTVRLAAQLRGFLDPEVRLPIPSEDKIILAQDKRYVHLLAQELGVPIPETFMLGDGDCLEEVAGKVHYPAVIKPRFSRFFQDGSWVAGEVIYAYHPEDLIAKYRAIHSRIPGPLVQERIEGEGRGVFLCMWGGELKAALCHRRLREKPPWGGVSVYSESVPLDEDLVRKAFELLRAIGWEGVAMVEFKVDRRDGRAKLMEINGRFWGSLQLSIDAGMNFPRILYRLAAGEDVPAQLRGRVGTKWRWLLGDLDQLLIQLNHADSSSTLGNPSVSKFRACMDFLKFYEAGLHYDVLRFEDPRPGWFELKCYVGTSLRDLGLRWRRSEKG